MLKKHTNKLQSIQKFPVCPFFAYNSTNNQQIPSKCISSWIQKFYLFWITTCRLSGIFLKSSPYCTWYLSFICSDDEWVVFCTDHCRDNSSHDLMHVMSQYKQRSWLWRHNTSHKYSHHQCRRGTNIMHSMGKLFRGDLEICQQVDCMVRYNVSVHGEEYFVGMYQLFEEILPKTHTPDEGTCTNWDTIRGSIRNAMNHLFQWWSHGDNQNMIKINEIHGTPPSTLFIR